MIWIIIGVALIAIGTLIYIKNSKNNKNCIIQSSSMQMKDFDFIQDILSKCRLDNPIKLSEYLKEKDASNRQDAIYSYLTSEKFKKNFTTIQFTELITDNKPDVIISSSWNGSTSLIDEDLDEDYIVSEDLEEILFDLNESDEYDDRIELPIKGINFRHLTNDCIGIHNGFLMLDKNNKHDKYAIGIYDMNGTHYGFVERGQKHLYTKVEENGGIIDGIVNIEEQKTGSKSFFYGTITIDKKYLAS